MLGHLRRELATSKCLKTAGQLSGEAVLFRLVFLREQSVVSIEIQQKTWRAPVNRLISAPANLEKTAQYIEHIFRTFEYTPETQEFSVEVFCADKMRRTSESISFGSDKHQTRNIVAEIKGQRFLDEVVIVGAHYDSVYDCPAANDNASGVAALLELSRLMKEQKVDCARSKERKSRQ